MVWGLLLGGRRYDSIDYICALTVTFGCALFVLTGSIVAPQLQAVGSIASAAAASKLDLLAAGGLESSSSGGGAGGGPGAHPWLLYGLLLLGAFLLFDGLTSTTQVGTAAWQQSQAGAGCVLRHVWSWSVVAGLLETVAPCAMPTAAVETARASRLAHAHPLPLPCSSPETGQAVCAVRHAQLQPAAVGQRLVGGHQVGALSWLACCEYEAACGSCRRCGRLPGVMGAAACHAWSTSVEAPSRKAQTSALLSPAPPTALRCCW